MKISFMKSKRNVTYVKKSFVMIKMKKRNSKYTKTLEIIVIIQEKFRRTAHSICNLNYKVPQEIPVKIHNGSTYDYHFIFEELAEEFKGQFECLGENTEKYITFSVPIEKEVVNGKKDNDSKKEDNDSKKEDEDNNSEKEKDNNSKKENNHVQNKVYWQL